MKYKVGDHTITNNKLLTKICIPLRIGIDNRANDVDSVETSFSGHNVEYICPLVTYQDILSVRNVVQYWV